MRDPMSFDATTLPLLTGAPAPVLTKLAAARTSLLLTGERGTMKRSIARAIAAAGPGRGELVALDCSALGPEQALEELFGRARPGALERARDGTVYLSDVHALPALAQSALVAALEHRSFRRVGGARSIELRARVIAGSDRDLRAEVAAKRFRAGLYYRLSVATLSIVPLRDRRDRLPDWIARLAGDDGSPELVAELIQCATRGALRDHRWPGNVGELRNWVARSLAHGAPADVLAPSAPDDVLESALDLPWTEARERVLRELERRHRARAAARTAADPRASRPTAARAS